MFDIFDECVYVCNIDVVNVSKCFDLLLFSLNYLQKISAYTT